MGASPEDVVGRITNAISEPNAPTDTPPVESETKAETPQGDTEAEETLYTVKVDGEEFQVPLDELRKSYMRESDYRKKSMSVAELKKEAEAKLSELDAKIDDAAVLLDLDLDYLESDEGKQLREDDPDKYLRKLENAKQKSEKIKAYKEERNKRELERQQEILKAENERLTQKIPDWLDPEVRTKESQEIMEILLEDGYTEDEISRLSDHRVFVLARDKLKLRKIMNQDLSKKEVKSPPKSANPGTSEKKATKTKEQKLRDNLRKSHHQSDAAALIKNLYFK